MEKCFDEFSNFSFMNIIYKYMYVSTDIWYTDVLNHVIRLHIGSDNDQKLEIVSTT
jgi:hypothetical protein